MIYNEDEYKVVFYTDRHGRQPVIDYINELDDKDQSKITKYIDYLRLNNGYLDEPYSRHINGKIRELRVDFSHNCHRIFYFTFINKKIVLLHAFLKNTEKTPLSELAKAEKYYEHVIINRQLYE